MSECSLCPASPWDWCGNCWLCACNCQCWLPPPPDDDSALWDDEWGQRAPERRIVTVVPLGDLL